MVEQALFLDAIFSSLADPTRRDILRRVAKKELSVGEIAKAYELTFAAISKHLGVLEKAKLILKHRRGKQQVIQLAPTAILQATHHLQGYERAGSDRLDRLEAYLVKKQNAPNKKRSVK